MTTNDDKRGEVIPVAFPQWVETPHLPPAGSWSTDFEPDVFFNMRDWLESAVRAKGAEVTGKGIGPIGADLDIKIDGQPFNVWIRPLTK